MHSDHDPCFVIRIHSAKQKKHVQETYAKQNNEAGSSIPPIHTSARRPIGHQTSTGQKVAHEKRVSTDLVAASWMAGSHPIHHLDVIKDGVDSCLTSCCGQGFVVRYLEPFNTIVFSACVTPPWCGQGLVVRYDLLKEKAGRLSEEFPESNAAPPRQTFWADHIWHFC